MHCRRFVSLAFLVSAINLFGPSPLLSQTTAPDTPSDVPPAAPLTLPEGPLQITITAVSGIVQFRQVESDPWKPATTGLSLAEGVDLRTGPRSAVTFTVTGDQTITLDRLGTVKILRAAIEQGTLKTDLGMKYGRTRYDIEASGRLYDAKVRSPSSVLAIRGTDVILEDSPGFTPRAVSVTGRARFRDTASNREAGFGGNKPTPVVAGTSGPAETARNRGIVDPGGRLGRTPGERPLLANLPGTSNNALGNLAPNDIRKQQNPQPPVAPGVPVQPGSFNGVLTPGRLEFVLDWQGDADLQIGVISAVGEPITTNPLNVVSVPTRGTGPIDTRAPSGAIASSDDRGGPGKLSRESVVWADAFPPGIYDYGVKYATGQEAVDYKLEIRVNGVVLDPPLAGRLTGPTPNEFNGDTVEILPVGPAPAPTARVASKRK